MSWDRDYFEPTDKLDRRPTAVWVLIAVSVAVFAFEFLWEAILFRTSDRGVALVRWLALWPMDVVHKLRVWQLATHLFLHADPVSLAFNMLLLYFLGQMLEELIGWRRLLALFLGGGLVAALAYVAIGYLVFPGLPYAGPAGALMAVLVMAALTWPNLPVWCFFLFRIKLKWLALFLVALDVWYSVKFFGVGSLAHLVAAGWGFGFYRLHHRVASKLAEWDDAAEDRAREKQARAEQEMDAEVDRILEKIAREGMTSLTASERRKLEAASRKKRVQ